MINVHRSIGIKNGYRLVVRSQQLQQYVVGVDRTSFSLLMTTIIGSNHNNIWYKYYTNGACIATTTTTTTKPTTTVVRFKNSISDSNNPTVTTNTGSSTNTTSTTTASTSTGTSTGTLSKQDQYAEYVREANEKMLQYDHTRELMKRGKLVNLRNTNQNGNSSQRNTIIQFSIIGTFVFLYLLTPLLGKKIAKDEEFRNKYIPNWYNFTIPKPQNAWTRQELHEQLVSSQRTLHERAIAGEFTPENIEHMRRTGTIAIQDQPHQQQKQQHTDAENKQIKQWESLHRGLQHNGDEK